MYNNIFENHQLKVVVKFIVFTFIFLASIIIFGIITSLHQKSESKNLSSVITISQNNTLLIGEIAFSAIFDDETYYDRENIQLLIRSIDSSRNYQMISDKNGFVYLDNIDNGIYELTKLDYNKKTDKYKLSYTLTLSLFFEVQKGRINNFGLIDWSYDKEQGVKHSKDYYLVRSAFLAKYPAQNSEWADTVMSEHAPLSNKRGEFDEDSWDIASLDTAREAEYMNAVEKDVILEMNKVRSDPKKYAQMYISPRLKYYNGTMYSAPNELPLRTVEGKKAALECYNALLNAPIVQILRPSIGLSRAAKDHVRDQSKTGAVGHEGSDKSSPFDRIKRYGGNYTFAGENIAYKPNTAREIVVGLLIDDGVQSRGHRDNIMHKDYNKAGVATDSHKEYGVMCVIEYAKDFEEKLR